MVDFASPLPVPAGEANRAPDPPKKCNKSGLDGAVGVPCGKPVSVLLAVCESGLGQSRRRRAAPLSEFTVGVGGPLRPGVLWVGWVARCSECYRDDQEANRG